MIARAVVQWFRAASCPPHLDTSFRLTAIALLLRPMGPWFVKPAILAIAALVLISPRALRTPALWAIVAAFVAVRIADDWPLADNHIYLIAYWTLAIALSLRALDLQATLATTSRWLLGMAFAFAVLWKAVLSPDFLDGRFFRVTLLTDPRFAEAAMLIGGLSDEELKANREALTALPEGAALAEPPTVTEPVRLRVLATVSTWGIVLLEAMRGAVDAPAAAASPGLAASRASHRLLSRDVRVCASSGIRMAPARHGRGADNRARQMVAARVHRGFPDRSLLLRSAVGRPGAGSARLRRLALHRDGLTISRDLRGRRDRDRHCCNTILAYRPRHQV